MNKQLLYFSIALFILMGLGVVSTEIAISQGHNEQNPIMKLVVDSTILFILLKLIVSIVIIFLMSKVIKMDKNEFTLRLGLLIVLLICIVGVVSASVNITNDVYVDFINPDTNYASSTQLISSSDTSVLIEIPDTTGYLSLYCFSDCNKAITLYAVTSFDKNTATGNNFPSFVNYVQVNSETSFPVTEEYISITPGWNTIYINNSDTNYIQIDFDYLNFSGSMYFNSSILLYHNPTFSSTVPDPIINGDFSDSCNGWTLGNGALCQNGSVFLPAKNYPPATAVSDSFIPVTKNLSYEILNNTQISGGCKLTTFFTWNPSTWTNPNELFIGYYKIPISVFQIGTPTQIYMMLQDNTECTITPGTGINIDNIRNLDILPTPTPTPTPTSFDPSGYIKDSNSNPLDRAKVTLSNSSYSNTVYTNPSGLYNATIYANGTYNYNVSKDGYSTLSGSQAFTIGQTNANFSLTANAGLLYGTVYEWNYAPHTVAVSGKLNGAKVVNDNSGNRFKIFVGGTLDTSRFFPMPDNSSYVVKVQDIDIAGTPAEIRLYRDGNIVLDDTYKVGDTIHFLSSSTSNIDTYFNVEITNIFSSSSGEIQFVEVRLSSEFQNKGGATSWISSFLPYLVDFLDRGLTGGLGNLGYHVFVGLLNWQYQGQGTGVINPVFVNVSSQPVVFNEN
jgi:hypothetical protein